MDLAASPMDGVLTPGWLNCRPKCASERDLAADDIPPLFKEPGLVEASLPLMRRLAEG